MTECSGKKERYRFHFEKKLWKRVSMDILQVEVNYTDKDIHTASLLQSEWFEGEIVPPEWATALYRVGAIAALVLLFAGTPLLWFLLDGFGFQIIIYAVMMILLSLHLIECVRIRAKRVSQGETEASIVEKHYRKVFETQKNISVSFEEKCMTLTSDDRQSVFPYLFMRGVKECDEGLLIAITIGEPDTVFIPKRCYARIDGELQSFLKNRLKRKYYVYDEVSS